MRDLKLTLEPIQAIDNLAKEWRSIEAAGKISIFNSWLWIGTWLNTLPDAFRPLLLRVTLKGSTVALAVLVRQQIWRHGLFRVRQIYFNSTGDPRFDCCFIEHNGFAAAQIDDHSLWQAFATWFAAGGAGADEVVINGLVSGANLAVPGLHHGIQYLRSFVVDLAAIATAGGDPAAQLSRNSRQQLRRAMRLCSKVGALEIDAARDAEEALAFFAAMKPLHIAHWLRQGRSHAYVNPYFEKFHRALIKRGIATQAIELLRVRAGSQVLGYLYNLRHCKTVYAYQSGFGGLDERLRVGYVSHALAIKRAALRGDVAYDFMAGSNRLKKSFASREYAMGWHILQKPKLNLYAERLLHNIIKKLRSISRR